MTREARDWFDHHVYGVEPRPPASWVASGACPDMTLTLRDVGGELPLRLHARLPRERPASVVVALNFDGNAATRDWPCDEVNALGWGIVTLHAADIDADRDDFTDGVHRLLQLPVAPRPTDGPGTLAAWAWGLSRVVDWLITRPEIDATRIAVLGHSRMGKAALLAAARDERFAAVVSNQSGCGGAALFRGKVGERIADITTRFPHWFCPAFNDWRGRDDELPFDQDALLAMIRPRPVLVMSAADDEWADPSSERRGAQLVDAEYRCRPGGHALGREDWLAAVEFLGRSVAQT